MFSALSFSCPRAHVHVHVHATRVNGQTCDTRWRRRPPFVCLTACMTREVFHTLVVQLQLNTSTMTCLRGSSAAMLRSHTIRYHQKASRDDCTQLIRSVQRESGGRGIVFCLTTKEAEQVSTRILGKTMRDAVRNTQRWKKAPYAYPRS